MPVDGENIGYVFRQTRNGVRIEPAATAAYLPKGTKGVKPGTRSERFAMVGVVTTEAEAKAAAAVLKAADAKRETSRATPNPQWRVLVVSTGDYSRLALAREGQPRRLSFTFGSPRPSPAR